ncbi:MAG: ArsR family transcriptional regulator [Gemmatimonadota bacterium]|nr:ArsR family transcriptional regulator [Gemmatimonadota bacterium]
MSRQARRFKDATYHQIAEVGRAVTSPRRLELLELLAQGPRTVEALALEAGQSVANASQHLQVLRAARLVEVEREGVRMRYRLADARVTEFCLALRRLAEARAEELGALMRDYLADRGLLEAVDQEELLGRVARGEVLVIDVRPVEEYQAGHIPGARSVPLAELQGRLAELPKRSPIVAYCRGPYCVLAIEAVSRLRALGFRAGRLEAGVPDWSARGLPLETGLITRAGGAR